MFARGLILTVHYPLRIYEILRRRPLPVFEHYLIVRIFKLTGSWYPVSLKYPNPVNGGNGTINLDLDLCQTSQYVYFHRQGQHEVQWISLIGLAMGEDKTFIDVGAHIGVFTITVAQAFPYQRIVAIEPLLSNYSKLQRNINSHCLSNVDAIQGAVTVADGTVKFFENPLNDGGGSLVEPTDYRTGDVVVNATTYRDKHPEFSAIHDVSSLALDHLINGPSVLKIDVEGAEASVLKSGLESLKTGLVELMVVEVTTDSVDEVINLVGEAGFDCFIYGCLQPLTSHEDFKLRLDNIVCLRRNSQSYDAVMAKFAQAAP